MMEMDKSNKPFPPQVTFGYGVHHSSRRNQTRTRSVWSGVREGEQHPTGNARKVTQESKARKVKEDMRSLGEGSWGEDIQITPQK